MLGPIAAGLLHPGTGARRQDQACNRQRPGRQPVGGRAAAVQPFRLGPRLPGLGDEVTHPRAVRLADQDAAVLEGGQFGQLGGHPQKRQAGAVGAVAQVREGRAEVCRGGDHHVGIVGLSKDATPHRVVEGAQEEDAHVARKVVECR